MSEHIVNFAEPREKNLFLQYLRGITEGIHRIKMEPFKRRSNKQNAYYWSVVIPIFNDLHREMGWDFTEEETHEELKSRFLGTIEKVNEITGEIKVVPKSTTGLSTIEHIQFIDRIGQWLAEFAGIVLPEPSKYRTKEPA